MVVSELQQQIVRNPAKGSISPGMRREQFCVQVSYTSNPTVHERFWLACIFMRMGATLRYAIEHLFLNLSTVAHGEQLENCHIFSQTQRFGNISQPLWNNDGPVRSFFLHCFPPCVFHEENGTRVRTETENINRCYSFDFNLEHFCFLYCFPQLVQFVQDNLSLSVEKRCNS